MYANYRISEQKRKKKLTSSNGDRTPAAMTIFKDVVSELIVFFR